MDEPPGDRAANVNHARAPKRRFASIHHHPCAPRRQLSSSASPEQRSIGPLGLEPMSARISPFAHSALYSFFPMPEPSIAVWFSSGFNSGFSCAPAPRPADDGAGARTALSGSCGPTRQDNLSLRPAQLRGKNFRRDRRQSGPVQRGRSPGGAARIRSAKDLACPGRFFHERFSTPEPWRYPFLYQGGAERRVAHSRRRWTRAAPGRQHRLARRHDPRCSRRAPSQFSRIEKMARGLRRHLRWGQARLPHRSVAGGQRATASPVFISPGSTKICSAKATENFIPGPGFLQHEDFHHQRPARQDRDSGANAERSEFPPGFGLSPSAPGNISRRPQRETPADPGGLALVPFLFRSASLAGRTDRCRLRVAHGGKRDWRGRAKTSRRHGERFFAERGSDCSARLFCRKSAKRGRPFHLRFLGALHKVEGRARRQRGSRRARPEVRSTQARPERLRVCRSGGGGGLDRYRPNQWPDFPNARFKRRASQRRPRKIS